MNILSITHGYALPGPCVSNGVTDCSQCDSNEGCESLSSASCACSPDCFTHGNCCPDVTHIQSCLGTYLSLTRHIQVQAASGGKNTLPTELLRQLTCITYVAST